MQYQFFTLPVWDSRELQDVMNRFLRGNKILEVEKQLVQNESGAYWCFCITWLEKSTGGRRSERNKRVDYKQILDEATFERFSKLRVIRKAVAADEGIPAFAIFTDEQLSGLAKLETIDVKSMLSIKGIGDKKVERYAEYFKNVEEANEKDR